MIEVNLLPRKEFEIILDGEVIPGKFGTWSAKRFSDKKGFSLSQLVDYYKNDDVSFDDVTLNILCAVEYGCRKKSIPFHWTDVDVCEWIDEMGGMLSEKWKSLVGHAYDKEDKPQKKTKKQLNGKPLRESPMQVE